MPIKIKAVKKKIKKVKILQLQQKEDWIINRYRCLRMLSNRADKEEEKQCKTNDITGYIYIYISL